MTMAILGGGGSRDGTSGGWRLLDRMNRVLAAKAVVNNGTIEARAGQAARRPPTTGAVEADGLLTYNTSRPREPLRRRWCWRDGVGHWCQRDRELSGHGHRGCEHLTRRRG